MLQRFEQIFNLSLVACLVVLGLANQQPAVAGGLAAGNSIEVKAPGVPAGTKVYLYEPRATRPKAVDSAQVDAKGGFAFGKKNVGVRGLYMVGTQPMNAFQVILGGDLLVKASIANGNWAQAAFDKNVEQVALAAYRTLEKANGARFAELQEEYNRLAKEGFAPNEQLATASRFKRRTDSLYTVYDKALKGLAKEYPSTHTAKVASFFLPANENEQEKTYFPGTMAREPEIAGAEWVRTKLVTFYQRYLPQDLEAYMQATLEAIDRCAAGSKLREQTLANATTLFFPMDPNFSRKLAKRWVAEYPASEGGRVLASMPPPQPEIGDLAPNIVLKDSGGKDISLESLRGQVVLVDFWASWCKPCREENPNVVRVYTKYKEKGFTIFSVSLDNSKERWLNAIAKDQLTWSNHVSDLKGWGSEGAKIYKVQSIPATFLLDKTGRIIGKDLRGGQLEKALETAFN
jgi:peroxiredoxin